MALWTFFSVEMFSFFSEQVCTGRWMLLNAPPERRRSYWMSRVLYSSSDAHCSVLCSAVQAVVFNTSPQCRVRTSHAPAAVKSRSCACCAWVAVRSAWVSVMGGMFVIFILTACSPCLNLPKADCPHTAQHGFSAVSDTQHKVMNGWTHWWMSEVVLWPRCISQQALLA